MHISFVLATRHDAEKESEWKVEDKQQFNATKMFLAAWSAFRGIYIACPFHFFLLLCRLVVQLDIFISSPENPSLDVISLLFVCHKNVIYLSPQHHTLNRSNELHLSDFIPPRKEKRQRIMTKFSKTALWLQTLAMWCNKKQPKSLHTHTHAVDIVEPLFFAPEGERKKTIFH